MFTALSLCGGGVPSATPGGVWRYLWCECPVSGLVQSSLKDKGQETGSHLSKTDHNSSTGQPHRNHTLERKVPKSPVLVSVSGLMSKLPPLSPEKWRRSSSSPPSRFTRFHVDEDLLVWGLRLSTFFRAWRCSSASSLLQPSVSHWWKPGTYFKDM